MAQHDYVIENQSFAALRADLNNALAAIATGNSGNAAPSVTYPYLEWNDTLNGLKKIRNASDTAWITIGILGTVNLGYASLAGGTFTGPVALPAGSTVAGYASLAGGTFTGPVVLPTGSTVAGYLPLAAAGCRNLLINGNPIINQRGYVSGTATTSANQFTLDRWFVVTSGQSVSWSDSLGIRTVTAPAGGMAQVVEGANIAGTGTHCLSWVGTATATVNGSAVANGGSLTLTGGANVTVRFSNGTWSRAQLEQGSTPTPFEERPLRLEEALARSYCQTGKTYGYGYTPAAGNCRVAEAYFMGAMRVVPSITVLTATGANVSGQTVEFPSTTQFGLLTTVLAAGTYLHDSTWLASAELTS